MACFCITTLCPFMDMFVYRRQPVYAIKILRLFLAFVVALWMHISISNPLWNLFSQRQCYKQKESSKNTYTPMHNSFHWYVSHSNINNVLCCCSHYAWYAHITWDLEQRFRRLQATVIRFYDNSAIWKHRIVICYIWSFIAPRTCLI
jgi:hypothetical protein